MFKLEMETDNAAFENNPEDEINRILKRVGLRVVGGETSGACMAANGNKVGTWEVSL